MLPASEDMSVQRSVCLRPLASRTSTSLSLPTDATLLTSRSDASLRARWADVCRRQSPSWLEGHAEPFWRSSRFSLCRSSVPLAFFRSCCSSAKVFSLPERHWSMSSCCLGFRYLLSRSSSSSNAVSIFCQRASALLSCLLKACRSAACTDSQRSCAPSPASGCLPGGGAAAASSRGLAAWSGRFPTAGPCAASLSRRPRSTRSRIVSASCRVASAVVLATSSASLCNLPSMWPASSRCIASSFAQTRENWSSFFSISLTSLSR
mmetsp:Transcript_101080/g.286469  ORF Transcript_101080/g.286469 Transcript_101080/m.286469 type:complete len:264 (-) Transcript_101080:182-973(-)